MPYIPVPKDLTRVKTKFLFNLTKRQLVCFGGGALVAIPLFFLLKGPLGNSSAAICMIVVMMPFFLFALYERNGLPLGEVPAVLRPGVLHAPKAAALHDEQLLCSP